MIREEKRQGQEKSPAPALAERDMTRIAWHLRLVQLLLRGVLRLAFRIRIRGMKNVPGGPLIICPNHLLWIDGIMVILFFPATPRVLALGREDEVLKTGFRRFVIDGTGVLVPLDFDNPVKAMRTMRGVLQRGGRLLIFPEGAVAGSREGKLLPLQEGAAHLSISAGVPILPVGFTGTRELWLGKTLTMRIGKPIDPAEFAQGDKRTRVRAMTARLEHSLRALLPGNTQTARIKPLRRRLTELFGPVD